MENATKALLIAGGVLLAMLLIAVLIFAWGRFSEYYEKQQSISEIEDVTEFNLRFTNYDRDNVYGYELLSLANQVADYNMRFSNYTANAGDEDDRSSKNNQNYTPIKMQINMNGNASKLWYDDETSHIFNDNVSIYTQSSTLNQIAGIIAKATGIEKFYGSPDVTAKLAKSINSLILSDSQIEYVINTGGTAFGAQKTAVENYNSIVTRAGEAGIDSNNKDTVMVNGKEVLKCYKDMVDDLTNNRTNIKQYYEYYQFKRGIFKCVSESIQYDQVSGRISDITFEFTGTIK